MTLFSGCPEGIENLVIDQLLPEDIFPLAYVFWEELSADRPTFVGIHLVGTLDLLSGFHHPLDPPFSMAFHGALTKEGKLSRSFAPPFEEDGSLFLENSLRSFEEVSQSLVEVFSVEWNIFIDGLLALDNDCVRKTWETFQQSHFIHEDQVFLKLKRKINRFVLRGDIAALKEADEEVVKLRKTFL